MGRVLSAAPVGDFVVGASVVVIKENINLQEVGLKN